MPACSGQIGEQPIRFVCENDAEHKLMERDKKRKETRYANNEEMALREKVYIRTCDVYQAFF